MTVPSDFLPTLTEAVHRAFELWHEGDASGSPFQELQLYQRARQQRGQSVRQATNQLLLDGLECLVGSRADQAKILRLRFVEERSSQQVANAVNIAPANLFKKQRAGIEGIADELRRQEWQLRMGRRAQLLTLMESPTYAHLFGVQAALQGLATRLLQPGPPWLIALEGIGGIGKTALADALVRHLIDTSAIGAGMFAEMAWVTARQRIFNGGGALKNVALPALTTEALVDALLQQLAPDGLPATMHSPAQKLAFLQQQCKAQPYLIVIDNLETVVDVEHLLTLLRTLANPTKFLLTTRQSLFSEADIHHWNIAELSRDDALALVRFEATQRNLPELATASDSALHPIYATVGGNPLALRLVVGQTHVHTLDQILDDLRTACGRPIEQLYTFIYRQAWESLEEPARRALLLLPLFPETGGSFADLLGFAQPALDQAQLRHALERLVTLNLVDTCGTLHERRYTIHSLTRTFLHRQVLRWNEDA
jgi:hypothetical protein